MVLAFPVKQVTQSSTSSLDWSPESPERLSESLNCQIKNNLMELQQLHQLCDLSRRVPDNPRREECERYLEQIEIHMNLIDLDHAVFTQSHWDVETYAIVALQHGGYFGHAYAWISPVHDSICMTMGIRHRIDYIFSVDELQRVSRYLLEGVRRLSHWKSFRSIVITHPPEIMKSILTELGFAWKPFIPRETIGHSLGGERHHFRGLDSCLNCYQSSRLHRPFTGRKSIQFGFIE